jgi:hypothetical protein
VATSKKRKTGKRKAPRQGLSGNPQRRAEQLRQPVDVDAFQELAWLMAGGAEPADWWPESHERILAQASARAWPTDPAGVETLTCELVGDEFYARFTGPEIGLHPAQWLVALAKSAAAALRSSLQNGNGDWAGLYALLCGLALTAPLPPDADSQPVPRFPDILDPYEVAQSEAGMAAKLLADRGLTSVFALPADGARPSGQALVARDAYGSRFLITAPFGYGDGETDHWYAWDIDQCWTDVTVAAGTFRSAEESLAEWRAVVGRPADASALAPCTAPVLAALLDSCLRTGPMADMLQGSEPRELIREFYRMRRRARALAWSPGTPAGASDDGSVATDTEARLEEFLEWYAARHGTLPAEFREIVGTLINEWEPRGAVDDRTFHACSPHRIEMTAHLLRNGYLAEYANESLAVLPDWTQWCLAQSDPGPELAARALDTARAEAAELAGDDGHADDDPDEKAPFRRGE